MITSLKKALFTGFLVWFVPFMLAFFVFFLRESNRALFESLMVVSLVATVLGCLWYYFAGVKANFFKEGLILGFIWLAISLFFDLPVFLGGFGWSILDYFSDIGLTYLIIPLITGAVGKILARQQPAVDDHAAVINPINE